MMAVWAGGLWVRGVEFGVEAWGIRLYGLGMRIHGRRFQNKFATTFGAKRFVLKRGAAGFKLILLRSFASPPARAIELPILIVAVAPGTY